MALDQRGGDEIRPLQPEGTDGQPDGAASFTEEDESFLIDPVFNDTESLRAKKVGRCLPKRKACKGFMLLFLLAFLILSGYWVAYRDPAPSGAPSTDLSDDGPLLLGTETDDEAAFFSYPGSLNDLIVKAPPGNKSELWTSELNRPQLGSKLVYYGPFTFEDKPRLVTSFVALADLEYVHHMVVYKYNRLTGNKPGYSVLPRDFFHQSDAIIFAWARAGQKEPLRFNTIPSAGVYIGPGTDAQEIYLNIHYEFGPETLEKVEKGEITIKAGLELTSQVVEEELIEEWADCSSNEESTCENVHALGVHILSENSFTLPPREENTEVVHYCRVMQNATIVAYRNHAHSAGRVFETRLYRDGIDTGSIIRRSVQEPQIFYPVASEGISLLKDDFLLLHCNYDTSDRTRLTKTGANIQNQEEMCNQYLMFTPLKLNRITPVCNRISPTIGIPPLTHAHAEFPDNNGRPRLPEAEELGEAAGVAVSQGGDRVFVFARKRNHYESTEKITSDTIYVLDGKNGDVLHSFGKDLFVTPHGLYCDAEGHLWVTDTTLHQVFKLDGQNGTVILELGHAWLHGRGETTFNGPADVVVDETSNLAYIADGYGNDRVVVLNATNGSFINSWSIHIDITVDRPALVHNIAFDTRRRRLFVADRLNCRLQIFDTAGNLETIWRSSLCQAFDKRTPWLADYSSVSYSARLDVIFSVEGEYITKRNALTGQLLETWGGDGRFKWPHDIEVASTASSPDFFFVELNGRKMRRYTISQIIFGDKDKLR